MKNNKENKMSRLIITLTIIGVISALALSFVYQWTQPYIEENRRRAREEAVFSVLPGIDDYRTLEKEELTFYEGLDKKGEPVGVAVLRSGPGFEGEPVEIMVGTDPKTGRIYSIRILEHSETPGLGARITEEEFLQHFREMPFGNYSVVHRPPETKTEVQSITGATISSEVVTEIVTKAVADIENIYGGGKK